MGEDWLLKLAERVGPATAVLVGLFVHHWRRRKGNRVAPLDDLLLRRMLREVGDLFGELADNENDARERHKQTMKRFDEIDEQLDEIEEKLDKLAGKRLSA